MTGRETPEHRVVPLSKAPGDAARVSGPETKARPLVLLGVLAVGVIVQLLMLRSHRIHWSSDQAIVGLMARHILDGTEHPVFYYGSAYAGTLESYYMASVFSVVCSSVAS